jgi:hypothetical protein
VLRQALQNGLPITSIMENWDFLQVTVINICHVQRKYLAGHSGLLLWL